MTTQQTPGSLIDTLIANGTVLAVRLEAQENRPVAASMRTQAERLKAHFLVGPSSAATTRRYCVRRLLPL